jgi:AAA family ATP:ADP antiporter
MSDLDRPSAVDRALRLFSDIRPGEGRLALLNTVTYFFVVCLVAFHVLGRAGVSVGIAYFLWIGVFNLMIVAQFWSFADDLYTREEGERLLPIVGFGASLGAVLEQ